MIGSNPLRTRGIAAADEAAITRAADILRAGELVAVPTETVYGLAADARNADAVARIYAAKGRPDFNPLIVHVRDLDAAKELAIFDDRAMKLADEFWPGPLTMVLPMQADAPVAQAVTAGLPTIALRRPAHPIMAALLAQSGLNLAAPSANKSGHISPTRAPHVANSLGDDAPFIIDGGACVDGLESTIVALRSDGWQLLRKGPVAAAKIAEILGEAAVPVTSEKIEAPGMLARHYAPVHPIRLNADAAMEGEWLIGFGGITGDDNLSPAGDLVAAAAALFDALHRADKSGRTKIAVATIPDTGIGAAINDRLHRAAAG